MRKAFLLTVLLAAIFHSGLIHSQQAQFTGEIASFPDEAANMLKANLTDNNGAAFNKFLSTWKSDSLFTDENKKTVIDIANRILKLKGRPYPHIYNFLLDIDNFYTTNHKPESYQNWLQGLSTSLQQPKVSLSRLNNLLENTLTLLTTGLLSKSGSVEWKASSGDFSFIPGDKVLAAYSSTDLTCNAKRDSITIYKTSGKFDPMDNLWLGDGGLVTWERAAYPATDVFANLKKYTIDLTKPSYTADSVVFTNKQYFNYTLLGTLTHEVKVIKTPEDADFPSFESYLKNFDIHNFYKNIDYKGGLSMQGAKLVGKGTQQENAYLNLYRHDSLFMKISSLYFVFRKDRVIGRNVGLTLLFEKDSIYHSELNFLYMVNTNEISFIHTDEYTSNGPYFNSYHNIDMSFDQLTWKVGDPKLILTMQRGASIGIASFESTNYFSGHKFQEIQGIDEIHPLVAIKKFVQYFYSEEFPATEYARYMKLPVELIRIQLLKLSVMGFVYYNIDTDIAKVKPKLYDYKIASLTDGCEEINHSCSASSVPQKSMETKTE